MRPLVLTHLPLFMELSNGFLQALLFLLGENVCELVASFQEGIEHPLIQLTEKLLARRGGMWLRVADRKNAASHPRQPGSHASKQALNS